jgi:hypothetical protein
VRTVDLHIPFNQVNVQTGKGYWEDVMARFWQAERHARGCADVAYVLKMMFSEPFHLRSWMFSCYVLECFILPTLIPWAAVGNFLSGLVSMFITRPANPIDDSWISMLFNFSTITMFVFLFIYELLTRRASKVLYGLEPVAYWRILEYLAVFLPGLFTMTVPTFVIAAFKVMLNRN